MTKNQNTIADFYDQRGREASEQLSGYGSRAFPQHLRAPYEYSESLQKKQAATVGHSLDVLDLCCGTGVHSIYPAQLGASVVGIDLSPKSIAVAKDLAMRFGVVERCDFRIGDAFELQRAPQRFDVVFISGALYYFDLPTVLPLIQALLKPGGIFIAVETYGDNRTMNLVRRVKTLLFRRRDERTMTALLRSQQIRELGTLFPTHEVRYFDALTLLCGLCSYLGIRSQSVHRWAAWLDDIFLNRLGLKFFAFKFVFSGTKL